MCALNDNDRETEVNAVIMMGEDPPLDCTGETIKPPFGASRVTGRY